MLACCAANMRMGSGASCRAGVSLPLPSAIRDTGIHPYRAVVSVKADLLHPCLNIGCAGLEHVPTCSGPLSSNASSGKLEAGAT